MISDKHPLEVRTEKASISTRYLLTSKMFFLFVFQFCGLKFFSFPKGIKEVHSLKVYKRFVCMKKSSPCPCALCISPENRLLAQLANYLDVYHHVSLLVLGLIYSLLTMEDED